MQLKFQIAAERLLSNKSNSLIINFCQTNMINDFLSKEDLALFGSGSRFTTGSVLLAEGKKDSFAVFDVYVRDLPPNRNYLVAAGLEHIADFLLNLRFSRSQVSYIEKNVKISRPLARYLRNFRLRGDLLAAPEGTLIFPNEPILRLTLPIIDAGIIEQYVINTIMLQTMLASKFSRVVNAAAGQGTGFVPVRTHGTDSAMKSIRIAKMVGFTRSGLLAAAYLAGEKTGGGVFSTHYFILSFPNELAAFRALAKNGGQNLSFLIDTYDFKKGLSHFITVAKESESAGIKLKAVAIDSGDLGALSRYARKMLDRADLPYIKITAASNLDEYSISKLTAKNTPIDIYAPCTEVLNVTDAPKLEVVYKMGAFLENGRAVCKMKFSPKKLSLPGAKQVFRFERSGQYVKDIIALESEKPGGRPMLVPIIKDGRRVYDFPKLTEIHDYYQSELKKFDPKLLAIGKKFKYPVEISGGLKKKIRQAKRNLAKVGHDEEGAD